MAIDAGWFAVFGAAAGAAGKGVSDALKLFIEGRREKAKREHDAERAELDRQAAATEATNTARRQMIREWRKVGLATST